MSEKETFCQLVQLSNAASCMTSAIDLKKNPELANSHAFLRAEIARTVRITGDSSGNATPQQRELWQVNAEIYNL